MTEEQSFLFDFKRVGDFWENWNIKFKVADMGVSDKFQLVFATNCPDNIMDCLNSGVLNNNVVIDPNGVIDCTLNWDGSNISFKKSATFNIGSRELMLKAIFIRDKATNYVMAYNINIDNFDVTNKLVFDAGTILWSIHDE